ncbi:MAG: DUF2807 domain-containing protein [Saprospiraceae bacterium]|nr:DUF2807 domain-containing protein [Saprospiraceae bacterium]
MKNQLVFALMGLILFTLPSCLYFDDDNNGIFNCVNGEGPVESFELFVPPFSGVEISGSMDVYITQGPEQLVIVEGQENIVDEIDNDVNNGVWDIDFKGCIRDYENIKVYITIPDVNYLKVSGSGKIVSENVIVTEDMVLRISGSGEIDLGLECESVDGKISGSGEVNLEGLAEKIDFSISGSGDLNAFGMETQKVELSISGSGDAEVWVTEILDVKISGSGDVFYRGYPVISADISGSGDLIDAN